MFNWCKHIEKGDTGRLRGSRGRPENYMNPIHRWLYCTARYVKVFKVSEYLYDKIDKTMSCAG